MPLKASKPTCSVSPGGANTAKPGTSRGPKLAIVNGPCVRVMVMSILRKTLSCLSQATRQLKALWQNKMNPIRPTPHRDFTIRSRTQDHCVIESGEPFKKQIAGTSGTGAVQILTLHFYCHDASLDSKYWGP